MTAITPSTAHSKNIISGHPLHHAWGVNKMVEKFVHLDMNYTFANSLVALSIMYVLVQVQSNNSLLGTIGLPH